MQFVYHIFVRELEELLWLVEKLSWPLNMAPQFRGEFLVEEASIPSTVIQLEVIYLQQMVKAGVNYLTTAPTCFCCVVRLRNVLEAGVSYAHFSTRVDDLFPLIWSVWEAVQRSGLPWCDGASPSMLLPFVTELQDIVWALMEQLRNQLWRCRLMCMAVSSLYKVAASSKGVHKRTIAQMNQLTELSPSPISLG